MLKYEKKYMPKILSRYGKMYKAKSRSLNYLLLDTMLKSRIDNIV